MSTNDSTEKLNSGPTFMQLNLEVARRRDISQTAKLLYGRLCLFAGKDGRCTPSHATLANEIGVGPRYIINALKELNRVRLVDWVRTGSSCSYTVHFPPQKTRSEQTFVSDMNICSDPIRTDVPIKRGLNIGSVKDVDRDLDCALTNHKTRDSQDRLTTLSPATPKQYPLLEDIIARYMADDPRAPKKEDYPTPRKVVEVMEAAGMCASESDVVECLRYHYNERGIRPGTKDYPRSFNWFPAVVAEHFRKDSDRADNSAALGFGWEERNEARAENLIANAASFDYCSDNEGRGHAA